MAFYTSVGWSIDRYGSSDPLRNDFEKTRPVRRAERLEVRNRLYGVPKIGEAKHDYSSKSWYASKYENHFQQNRDQRRTDRKNINNSIENKSYKIRGTVDPYTTKYKF